MPSLPWTAMVFFVTMPLSFLLILRPHKWYIIRIGAHAWIKAPRQSSTSLHPLFCTRAAASNMTIEPTYFEEDLYKVLGLPFTATRQQIKESYLKKVYENHPDRNSSESAIHVFRNVTHAYSILGKDPVTKREYDTKYQTELYVEALGEVGTGVLEPLAVGVALPLLNLTLRGLGNFAIPLIRDAYEQGSVVLKAALVDLNTTQEVSEALQRKQSEQQMRSLQRELTDLQSRFNASRNRLQETSSALSTIDSTFAVQQQMEERIQQRLKVLNDEESQRLTLLQMSNESYSSLVNVNQFEEREVVQLTQRQREQQSSIADTRSEIAALETALKRANGKLDELISQYSRTTEMLSQLHNQLDIKRQALDLAKRDADICRAACEEVTGALEEQREALRSTTEQLKTLAQQRQVHQEQYDTAANKSDRLQKRIAAVRELLSRENDRFRAFESSI